MGAQNISHPGCHPGSESRGKHPGNFCWNTSGKTDCVISSWQIVCAEGKIFPPHSHHSLPVSSVADG